MFLLRKHFFLFILLVLFSVSPGRSDQLQSEYNPESSGDSLLAATPVFADAVSASPTAPDPAPEVNIADLTDDERRWYQRFQEGVPFFDGWKKITERVLEKFPESEREQKKAIMQALGMKIGCEWSRDDSVRKVNTDMLQAWGKDLRQAGAQNHRQLALVIRKIDREVNALLSQQ